MKAIFLLSSILLIKASFAQTDSVVLHSKKNSLVFSYGFIHNRSIDEGIPTANFSFMVLTVSCGSVSRVKRSGTFSILR
jgi:hypothetical protein